MGPRVVLFSKDQALANSCGEIMSEIFGTRSGLVIGSPGHDFFEQDVCIWDFNQGETCIPNGIDPAQLKRHFFLLPKNPLAWCESQVGAGDLNILLKPVSRVVLRALIATAALQGGDCGLAAKVSTGDLRAERDNMLQILIHANLRIQEYDHEKTNVLARCVHDLQAPITALTGYCGLLLEEDLGSLTVDQREILQRMQRSGARLTRIADTIFQLSAAQTLPEANLERADIRDSVDQALHELAPVLQTRRIAITVEIEPPPEGLLFERTYMEQTLVNLLENACKYTPRGGSIDIKGYAFFWNRRVGPGSTIAVSADRRIRQVKAPNSFRVDIHDSGPAIPAAHLDKLFEEYTSYSSAQDRSGGGLGLAICRTFLQRHCGRIWAESGLMGTKFSFVLPLQNRGVPARAGEIDHGPAQTISAVRGGVDGCR